MARISVLGGTGYGGSAVVREAARRGHQVTAFSRRNLPQPAWGRAVAVFTLLFAIGQTIGPVVAGILGDFYGDIRSALLGSGLVLALGTLIALMQRTLTPESL